MDWDKELRRQAAISALLASPESDQTDALPELTDITEPKSKADFHKLINEHFDTSKKEEETPLEIPTPTPESSVIEEKKYPTIAEDQGAAVPVTPSNLITDPETGTRYAVDQESGGMVPYAEPATAADKAAFRPTDAVLPQVTSEATARSRRAELIDPDPDAQYLDSTIAPRATLVQFPKGMPATMPRMSPYRDPDPDNPDYKTPLSPDEETRFRSWIKKNNIPFNDSATSDYDMRGYWKAQQEGDPNAVRSSKNLHFPDTYKTPFHKTFSNESQYATSDAPHWEGDKLIDKDGNVVADETPEVRRGAIAGTTPRAEQVQDPLVARSIAANIAAQRAPAPTVTPSPSAPAPAATPPPSTAPTEMSLDDLNSFFSPKKEAAPSATTSTERVMPGGASLSNTDSRITNIVSNAARVLPEGYTIRPTSGLRTAGQGQHTLGKAQDWQIYGPDGKPIVNRGDDTTGLYTSLARAAYGYQEKYYPELTGKFQWGGQFGTSAANLNEPDLMHFDIGGRRGRISRYSRENIGAELPPEAGGTVAQSDKPEEITPILDSHLGGLLSNKGYVFVEMGEKYHVDPKLIAAIAMEETGNGTSKLLAERNNVGGLTSPGHTGVGGNYASFSSIDDGIEAVAKNLRHRYLDQGLTDIKSIGSVYAPPDAKNDPHGTNRQWPGAVQTFYNRLKGTGVLDTSALTVADKKNEWGISFAPATQNDLQAGRAEAIKILGELKTENQNPAGFLKLLEQPISGVSDDTRKWYADQFKTELTKYAQSYYSEPDPTKALARATGDANFGTFIENTWKGALTPVAQVDLGLNEMSKNSDFMALDKFAQVLHPESNGAARAAFIKTFTDIKDPNVRSKAIGTLWAQLDPTRQATIDINGLVQAADNVASPEYQAAQDKALAVKETFIKHLQEADPTIKGTPGQWWSGQIGQFMTNAAMTTLSAPLRTTAFVAQFYAQHHEEIKAQHPDWTEDQISAEAGKTAFLEQLPQDVLMALAEKKLGPLSEWVARMKNPVVRAGVGGAIHEAVGASMGVAQQVGTNVGMNRPLFENVPQAAGQAALTTLPFGLRGGLHALVSPHVEPPPVVHEPVEPVPEIRPTETGVLHGPGEIPSVQPRPVTVEQNVPETPMAQRPWYMEGVGPGQDPLVIRGAERTTFTPQELAAAVQKMPAGSPEELRARAEALRPAAWFLGDENDQEIQQAQKAQAPQPPQTLAEAIRQRRAAASLSELKPSPFPENYLKPIPEKGPVRPAVETQAKPQAVPIPPRVGEADPYVSKIANRYTVERIATGELGPVDPSEGQSTEHMVMQGLQMTPEQRERLINNFNRGVGGDIDTHGAAIRSQEAILSENSRVASRAAMADPNNLELKAQAKATLDALTAFHNGPVKKFKKNWSDAGRVLQREIPVDFTTVNGLKEAYLKGNGKEIPAGLDPKLNKIADQVVKIASKEQAVMQNWGREIEARTRGNPISDEHIRTRLMEIMPDLPCRN